MPHEAPAKETLEEALLRVNPHRGRLLGDKARASDAREAQEVRRFLVGCYEFPGSVYQSATRSATGLEIYGVLDPDEQARVLALLRDEHATRGWKPIRVRFRKEERLETNADPSGPMVTRRLEEELLREAWIR